MSRSADRSGNDLIVACPACWARFRFEPALFRGAPGVRVRCRRCGEAIEIRNPDVPSRAASGGPPSGGADLAGDVGCPACGARFRFDRALFRDRPGARVRCRRCGEPIDVRNPESPSPSEAGERAFVPDAPACEPDAVVEDVACEPEAPPDGSARESEAHRDDSARAADAVLDNAAPEPEAAVEYDAPAAGVDGRGGPGVADATPPIVPAPDWKELSDVDGPTADAPSKDAATGAARPSEPGTAGPSSTIAPVSDWKELSDIDGRETAASGGDATTRDAAPRTVRGDPGSSPAPPPAKARGRRVDIYKIPTPVAPDARGPARRSESLLPYLGAALAFLSVLAGALWYLESPRPRGAAAVPRAAAPAPAGPHAAAGKYEFDRIETSYPPNRQAGTLFVLKGRVSRRAADAGSPRVRVRVTILDAGKEVVAQKTVLAGVVIPDAVLRESGRADIEQAIAGAAAPPEAAADGAVPFMAVFFDVVGKFSSYELAAEVERKAEETDRRETGTP